MASDKHSFAIRWSPAIQEHGFTSVPNLLLYARNEMDITTSEFLVLVAIDSFRWNAADPWPGMRELELRTGLDRRTVRRRVSGLESKGLVLRNQRVGLSNKYDFRPLIDKLDRKAISSLPPGKDRPPGEDKLNEQLRTSMSSKEYTDNKTIEKPTNNNGVEDLSSIIDGRYANKAKRNNM